MKITEIIVISIIVTAITGMVFFFTRPHRRSQPTVLMRKEGAVVLCKQIDWSSCGLTLECGDGTTVYCATNVEVK